MTTKKKPETLAEFEDRAGRTHKVVLMADRLVLDMVGQEPPRVVALLRYDEGLFEAEAIVFGREGEDGYIERAKREMAPLCRPLELPDLKAARGEPTDASDDDGRVAA